MQQEHNYRHNHSFILTTLMHDSIGLCECILNYCRKFAFDEGIL